MTISQDKLLGQTCMIATNGQAMSMASFIMILVLPILNGSAMAQTVPFPVAITGAAAPTGGNFTSFGSIAVLNTSGQVAFFGVVGSSTVGIFAGTPGSLQTVALQGTAAPSGGNYSGGFDIPALNASGQIAFYSSLVGGSSSQGIFVGSFGSLQAVALKGNVSPGGGNYNLFGTLPVLDTAGQVAFFSTLTGGSSSQGIFAGTPSVVQAVALSGSPAPAGGNYSGFGASFQSNATGQLAFSPTLTGGTSSSGVFAGTPGLLQTVALSGTAAPSGGNYNGVGGPAINSIGQVAFQVGLSGGSSSSGIFVGSPGLMQTIALTGSAAPSGGNYSSLTNPVLNSAGQVAFSANLTGGTSTSGIFRGTPGSLQAIALQGDATPVGTGVSFSSFNGYAINSIGQVAFLASLTGTDVGTGNNTGLYAGVPGNVTQIVRKGDVIDVDPGAGVDNRTISAVNFYTGYYSSEGGQRMAFNDSGLLVYELAFTDGSTGIFTSQIAAVPEPATLLLLAVTTIFGVISVWYYRRKQVRLMEEKLAP